MQTTTPTPQLDEAVAVQASERELLEAVRASWNECVRNVFSLADQTADETADKTGDFERGRRFEAKGIAKAMSSFGPEHCEGLREWFSQCSPYQDTQLTAAMRDVLAERRRQVDAEGWTPTHDDGHDEGELSMAAAGYSISASDQIQCVAKQLDDSTITDAGCANSVFPHGWVFKPASPRRMLVKAAALILAEIERLDRAALSPTSKETQ